MEPLARRYDNLVAWKLTKLEEVYQLKPDGNSVFKGYSILSLILTLLGTSLFFFKFSDIPYWVPYLLFALAFLSLFSGWIHSRMLEAMPHMFSYYAKNDVIEFTTSLGSVENAIERLAFSYEVHCGASNYPNSELNVVLDGSRIHLLSSRGMNSTLLKVIAQLEALGFKINKYRHPDV